MTHNLRLSGFLLQPAVHPRLHHLARAVAPANGAPAQLLLQRQRHQAFISTLAHELRQPLSTLFSAVAILREERNPIVLERAVEIIDRQAREMNRLVEDLVESARWARGTTLLRTQRIDLRAQIAEAISDAGEAISERRHRVVASHTPEPLWVEADSARLRQVLSNLLDNAIKFTEPGGRIELTTCRVGKEIVVRVRDTGRGLRPHELAHIFELFSQARPGEGRGLGIGLNVVWQIVAMHKGRIEVRSDGPSRGTEFIVTLPAATSSETAL